MRLRCFLMGLLMAGMAGRAMAAPATMFQITSFASPAAIEYPAGFSGTVGATALWPSEMGWQGDRIDIAFTLPSAPPPNIQHYRFRIAITQQFTQAFELAIEAGPSIAGFQEVHREYVDTARVYVATIPADRFTFGQTNYIRLRGYGVQVGQGQPAGIQWNKWTLTRTDFAGTADAFRLDQLQRLTNFIVACSLSNGLVRDGYPYDPSWSPFHPASPDAAGFALIGLCVADQMGLLADAEVRAESILRTYSGNRPGLLPLRNARGHWWHWIDVSTGQAAAGWGDAYTTIGSALLMGGAMFARNHFIENSAIAGYVSQMYASCDFDSMISPALDGRVAVSTDAAGNALGYLVPWNEYMICVSMALRQPGATRAPQVAWRWLDPANCPKRHYPSFTTDLPTLTDNTSAYAPAFWVHQQYFFNADFSTHAGFVALLDNHRIVDSMYCGTSLSQPYRYGLSAGVSPSGYTVDRVFAHQNVFSPEAVAGFGDMDTLLEFAQDQPPTSNSRYRFGLVRTSSAQPGWIPNDAALVDHLFLMYGLMESIDPLFFKQRQPFQTDSDADGIADAFDNCPSAFNPSQSDGDADGVGDACELCPGDVNGDGAVNLNDLTVLLANFGTIGSGTLANGDLDGNGDINLVDLTLLLAAFGAACP